MGEFVPDPGLSRSDGTPALYNAFDRRQHASALDADVMHHADHAAGIVSELPLKLACWLVDGGATSVAFAPPVA